MKKSVFFLIVLIIAFSTITVSAAELCAPTVIEISPPELTIAEYGTTPKEYAGISLFNLVSPDTGNSSQIYQNILKLEPEFFMLDDEGLCKINEWDDMTAAELDAVKSAASEIMSDCTTDDQKIFAVIQYLATNIGYDYDNYDVTTNEEYEQLINHHAYDVLTEGYTVCYGYAATAMALLQSEGVPCILIQSPNHAWNMAYNGERWILFDITWISNSSYENGVLTKSQTLDLDWFDYTIQEANANYNHIITKATYTEYDNTIYSFPAYTKYDTFIIPSHITAISDYAFWDAHNLKNIGSLENVVSIGYASFCDCISLVSDISLSNAVSIGDFAFDGCAKLGGTLNFENLTSVGSQAFCGCSSIDGISGGDKLVSVGDAAFYNCSSMSGNISLNNAVSIGNSAFEGCSSIDGISGGDKLVSVGNAAFYNCSSMSGNISLNNAVSIGDFAFDGCAKLGGTLELENLTSVGIQAFCGCSSIDGISGGDKLVYMGDSAFAGCTELSGTLNLENLTTIGTQAFFGCSSLNGVTGMENIESIGKAAFYNCSALDGTIDLAKAESIGEFAFSFCTNLDGAILPVTDISIGNNAFQDCSSLTIYSYNNSSAQAYASANVIDFALIDTLSYTVSYNANGGNGAPSSLTKTYGASVIIPQTVPTLTGHSFIGWSISEDGDAVYFAGDEYSLNSDVTFYAVWEKTIIYGDIKGDGKVDVSDVIFILQFLASSDSSALTNTEKTICDVNCDGSVDVSDVIRILQYLASSGTILGPAA